MKARAHAKIVFVDALCAAPAEFVVRVQSGKGMYTDLQIINNAERILDGQVQLKNSLVLEVVQKPRPRQRVHRQL